MEMLFVLGCGLVPIIGWAGWHARKLHRALTASSPLPCAHKWKVVQTNPVYGSSSDARPTYHRVYMQCESCGDMQSKDLK